MTEIVETAQAVLFNWSLCNLDTVVWS